MKFAKIPGSVGIIYKYGFAPARKECKRLKDWFLKRGIEVYTEEMASSNLSLLDQGREEETSIPETVDWVIVLGGDGTLLGAARKIVKYGLPILGVNLGGLGFLTEIPLKTLYREMEYLIKGNIEIESRLMLRAGVFRDNEEKYGFSVLNDVVINKGALARIIDLRVSINNYFLTTFKADGLIVSSPTGSTGYNLSAGGPIIYPDLEAFIVTPICPFTLTHRPIILRDDSVIEILIGDNREEVIITFDGQVGFHLQDNDRIKVSKSENKLRLIKSPSQDYFEILRTKLKWGESSYRNEIQ